MDMVNFIGLMVNIIKDIIKMMLNMEKVNLDGIMDMFFKVILLMDKKKVKVLLYPLIKKKEKVYGEMMI